MTKDVKRCQKMTKDVKRCQKMTNLGHAHKLILERRTSHGQLEGGGGGVSS